MASQETVNVFIYGMAIFVIVNTIWSITQMWQWAKRECRPPEEKQSFESKHALMLEEVFRYLTQTEPDNLTEDMIKEMHRWQKKRRPDGSKKIYIEQSSLDLMDQCLRSILELKKVIKRIDKKTKRKEPH